LDINILLLRMADCGFIAAPLVQDMAPTINPQSAINQY
jgi:hypothetical protein